MYYVNADASNELLLDMSANGIAVGINLYDPKRRTIYMTTIQHNTVIASLVK